MFGKKGEDENKNAKVCPFAFSLALQNKATNPHSKCIGNLCQMWDQQRGDCGLKQK